jgi:hypothetical protein
MTHFLASTWHWILGVAAFLGALWTAVWATKPANLAPAAPAQPEPPQNPIDLPPNPSPPSTSAPTTPPSHLEAFTAAIAQFEGFYTAGTIPKKCNNPGDLRWPYGQPWPYTGVTGVTPGQFLIFDTADHGWAALDTYVKHVCLAKSKVYNDEAVSLGRKDSSAMTIYEFFGVFSPTSDNNPTKEYAVYVASACGLTIDDPMSAVYSEA